MISFDGGIIYIFFVRFLLIKLCVYVVFIIVFFKLLNWLIKFVIILVSVLFILLVVIVGLLIVNLKFLFLKKILVLCFLSIIVVFKWSIVLWLCLYVCFLIGILFNCFYFLRCGVKIIWYVGNCGFSLLKIVIVLLFMIKFWCGCIFCSRNVMVLFFLKLMLRFGLISILLVILIIFVNIFVLLILIIIVFG